MTGNTKPLDCLSSDEVDSILYDEELSLLKLNSRSIKAIPIRIYTENDSLFHCHQTFAAASSCEIENSTEIRCDLNDDHFEKISRFIRRLKDIDSFELLGLLEKESVEGLFLTFLVQANGAFLIN